MTPQSASVVFSWSSEDFQCALESCDRDECTRYILKYLAQSGKTIEAGCGLGRFVKYLSDRGYDIEGLELSAETIRIVREKAPHLKLVQADVCSMPYQTDSIDGIISLGVVEHFPLGPSEPLKEMHRVLKPRGIAVITVPSLNLIRRAKRYLRIHEMRQLLSPTCMVGRSSIIRGLLGRFSGRKTENVSYNRNGRFPYAVYPILGDFLEYRFTKKQFEAVLVECGYTIVESVPIGHMDGICQDFGKLFVTFRNWEFFPNIMGRVLNRLLSKIAFCHNHMHLCVVRKD